MSRHTDTYSFERNPDTPDYTLCKEYKNNATPHQDLPLTPHPERDRYIDFTLEERLNFWMWQLENVVFIEYNSQLDAYLKTKQKCLADPQLADYKFQPPHSVLRAISIRVMAQKACASLLDDTDFLEDDEPEVVTVPKGFEKYFNSRYYFPPQKRLLITRNLTLNLENPIPVYCDIPCRRNLPPSFLFQYSDVNYVDLTSDWDLEDAKNHGESEGNLIKCECCTSHPVIKCYENPECPCYQANKKFQDLQSVRYLGVTEFSTFRPMRFTQPFDNFYEKVAFSCSELCACGGKCDNNVIHMLGKRLFPFEVYRKDLRIGFGVRSRGMIPLGTPIMEFTGELVRKTNLDLENQDYAYQVSYNDEIDDEFWTAAQSLKDWCPEFRNALETLSKCDYYLDPKTYGNVTRFCNHSCIPSCEIIRVFQKSITPIHCRLVLVTLETIYPGGEITLDYGPEYMKVQLDGKCCCGTFACANGPDHEYYSQFHYSDLGMLINAFDNERSKKYNEIRSNARARVVGEKTRQERLEEEMRMQYMQGAMGTYATWQHDQP